MAAVVITVGISGFSSADNPGPGPGIARSLKAAGLDIRIVGLCYDAMETGILAGEGVDRAFLMPYPSAGAEALAERLLYIKASHGLDFVVPSLDVELPLYIRLADRLDGAGIASCLPSADQLRLRGKDRLDRVAESMGIGLPATEIVTCVDELYRALEKLPPPVMVKGACYKALAAYSVAEAAAHYHAIVAEWGPPVLIQRMVTGEEVNLVAVGDGCGSALGMVAMKKMQTTSLGKVWTGISIHHPQLLEAARKFVAASQWRGPFELECILADGKLHLIEINPRFPAWSWFATSVGVNLPAMMMRRHLRQPQADPPDYRAGQLFVRYVGEKVMSMDCLCKLMLEGEA